MALMPSDRLLRISKATSREVTLWREGVSLESATGQQLDSLRLVVAVDR